MAAKKPASNVSQKKITTPTSTTSAVRNSPIPKVASPAGKSAAVAAGRVGTPTARAATVTDAMVAQRAYEISQSGTGGGELDNWLRAERELRGV